MKKLATTFCMAGVCLSFCHKLEAEKKPNILLILADDMGYSDIGCYGGEINTPNIDKLARDGVRFTQFYNAARCCPTRASLLTGLYPHQAGVGDMVYRNQGGAYLGYLNNSTVTLAEVLKEAGYKTLMSGKWHVGHKEETQWPSHRGFDRFYGIHIHVDSYYKVLENCDVYLDDIIHIPATDNPVNDLDPGQEWYTTDVFTDYAVKFMDEASKTEKPFFMYLAYNAPHWPLEAPSVDIEKYRGKYMMGWDRLREDKFRKMKELGIIPGNEILSPSGNPRWDTLSDADKKEFDFRRAIYAAQIDRLDQNIGRVIDHLEKTGELNNTIILFLSDNGCSSEDGMFGFNWPEFRRENYKDWNKLSNRSVSQGQAWANASNTPFRLYKKWVHEGGIATPFIVKWPGVIKNKGSLTNTVAHVIDIMPTLCEVAGIRYPEVYNGRDIKQNEGISLVNILEGRKIRDKRKLYWSHEGNNAVRIGDLKMVMKNENKEWELYDLGKSRSETVDISGAFPEKVEFLKNKYFRWAERCGVKEWPVPR
jgi:arylsulfatase A-like enzyme